MEERIKNMLPYLNERQRRLFLANEAISYGRGGISEVSRISGASRKTIRLGIHELRDEDVLESGRIRRKSRGRPRLEESYPNLYDIIKIIVNGHTYGNPEKVLSWTTLSLQKIQEVLSRDYRINISFRSVATILKKLGYSRQKNKKALQVGEPRPGRDEQFRFINDKAQNFIDEGEPVISVDTKKKENVGNFRNNGDEYRKTGDPREVFDHDFPSDIKAVPYGIYNLNNNTGFVNLGVSHDTAEFSVESISRWWETVGKHTFPNAKKLMITCDCGGSNGYRVRLWKYGLSEFAKRTGLELHVSHFPQGTSKWNKVEHRLFCYISANWQGKPLIDIKTIVELIGSTTTSTGLKVICQMDEREYKLSQKVSEAQLKSINLIKIQPFENWNYIIMPY